VKFTCHVVKCPPLRKKVDQGRKIFHQKQIKFVHLKESKELANRIMAPKESEASRIISVNLPVKVDTVLNSVLFKMLGIHPNPIYRNPKTLQQHFSNAVAHHCGKYLTVCLSKARGIGHLSIYELGQFE
jgi:uncharacterized protein YjaZ